jgi:hypothetical protein
MVPSIMVPSTVGAAACAFTMNSVARETFRLYIALS